MGIYDHKDPLIPTDTFGRPVRETIVMNWPEYYTNDNRGGVKPEPPLKGRAPFSKFHAKDVRKPTLR